MIDKYRNVLYAKRWKINVILSHFFVFFSCIDFCNWSTETPFFDHWLHRSFVLRHKLWSSFDLSGEEFCIIEKYTGQEPSGFSFKRLWGPTASKFDKTLLNWTLIANPWVGYRLFYGGGVPKSILGIPEPLQWILRCLRCQECQEYLESDKTGQNSWKKVTKLGDTI